ncbi:hypothetical protein ABZP36_034311 [Zizania latifolia]
MGGREGVCVPDHVGAGMRMPQEHTIRDLYDRTWHKDPTLLEESAEGRGSGQRVEEPEHLEVVSKMEEQVVCFIYTHIYFTIENYCMRVMIPEVPESDWLCEECQTEIQIEKERNILDKSQAKVSTISLGNKVKDANVGDNELSEESPGNYTSCKRTKEDAQIIDKSEPGMCNVCCAPCSSCVHRNCLSFPMGSEEGNVPSGCTSTGKEEDTGSCIGVSEVVYKHKTGYGGEQTSSQRNDVFSLKSLDGEGHSLQSQINDVLCTSEVNDNSSMDVMKKSSSTRSEFKSSEEVEDQQAKVCDICGDVGAEEELAVCSRCSDGAEHTYCMRVMMEEVPEAEWLCETCHTEVGNEKKKNKIETSNLKVGGLKGQSFEGPMNKHVNAANSRTFSENGMHAEYVGSKVSERGKSGNEGNRVPTKRKDEDTGITSPARQNPLSRERSFKLDTNKGRDHAGHVSTSLASNALKNPTPPLCGQLSKSTSFNNSKVPKVKQLLIEVPQKPMGILAKSASFKKPKSFNPINKAKPSSLPHAVESTVMNPVVSQNAQNDILASILGCHFLTGPLAVPVPSKTESSGQHLNKGNKMADLNILGTAGGEGARSFIGHSKLKKPLHTKGPGMSTNSEEPLVMLGPCPQRKATKVQDSSHRVDQIKCSPNLRPNNSSSGHTMQCEHIASTIPERNYSWQGGFELWKIGRSPALCEGLQAHLSCFASPKVLEVAKKLPSKIQLEELPRQNLWPPQFHENGPTNDSIGLFFFARDTQSYENHYSKLVENMLKDDLALRGNIDTIELLIFASNTLSKNFQRWNMFHFLWGVFRVRRKDALNLPPNVPIHANHQGGLNGLKSSFHYLGGKPLEGQSNDSITPRFPTNKSSAISDVLSAPTRKNQKLAYSEQEEKMWNSSDGNGCDVNFDVDMEQNTCGVSPVNEKGNESTTIELDSADHLMDGGDVNATEVSSGNVDTISHVSGGAHKRNVEVANWDDKVNGRPEHKKIKLDAGVSVTPC